MLSQFKDLFRIPFHVTPDPNEKVDRGKCVFQCCTSEFPLAFFHTNQIVVTETKSLPVPGSKLKLPNVPSFCNSLVGVMLGAKNHLSSN